MPLRCLPARAEEGCAHRCAAAEGGAIDARAYASKALEKSRPNLRSTDSSEETLERKARSDADADSVRVTLRLNCPRIPRRPSGHPWKRRDSAILELHCLRLPRLRREIPFR